MIRRIILPVLLVSFLLGACGNISSSTDKPLDNLVITTSKKISYGPIFIAEAEGFFEEFGIQITRVEYESSTQAVALIVSGDVDIFNGTVNTGLLNILNLEPSIKVVADRGHIATTDECTYAAIVVRKDLFESGAVTSAADLKGHLILSNNTGIDAFVVGSFLAQGGLTVEDVEISNLPKNAVIDAFENKTISAAHLAEPDLTLALNANNSVILVRDEDIVGSLQTGVVVFGKKLLIENPDLGARFLAAYLKGVRQFNEGKTERNLQILAENLGTTTDVLAQGCWPSFNLDGSVAFDGVGPFQEWAVDNGSLDKAITEEQFYSPDFLEAARHLLNQ
jgi:NitT/TauT family transport system substrate-binding protein